MQDDALRLSPRDDFNAAQPALLDSFKLLIERALIERGIKKKPHFAKFEEMIRVFVSNIQRPILIDIRNPTAKDLQPDNVDLSNFKVKASNGIALQAVYFRPTDGARSKSTCTPRFLFTQIDITGFTRVERDLPISINLGQAGYRYNKGSNRRFNADHEDMRFSLLAGIGFTQSTGMRMRGKKQTYTPTVMPHKDGLFLGFAHHHGKEVCPLQGVTVLKHPQTGKVLNLPAGFSRSYQRYDTTSNFVTFVPKRELEGDLALLWDKLYDFLDETPEKPGKKSAQDNLDCIWAEFTGSENAFPETKLFLKRAKQTRREMASVVRSDLWQSAMEGVLIRIRDRMPEIEKPDDGLKRLLRL